MTPLLLCESCGTELRLTPDYVVVSAPRFYVEPCPKCLQVRHTADELMEALTLAQNEASENADDVDYWRQKFERMKEQLIKTLDENS